MAISTLLKEAVIDAKALRDAAENRAKDSILEKYSREIKSAVDLLLENETIEEADENEEMEPEMSGLDMDDFAFDDDLDYDAMGDDASTIDSLSSQIPAAFVSSDIDDCDCDDDEEIEIDFDSLMQQSDEEDADPSDMLDREEEAEDMMSGEFEDDDEMLAELDADRFSELFADDEDEINEEMVVDVKPTKSGWTGRPDDELRREYEKLLASTTREETADVEKKLGELQKENNDLRESFKKLKSNYKQRLSEINENLQSVNLSRAKLFYENNVLKNTSLNERQKQKLVEAIQNTKNVEETKIIYETLQDTVVSTPKPSEKGRGVLTESLREAVSKRPTATTTFANNGSNAVEENQVDGFSRSRLQKLAGIK